MILRIFSSLTIIILLITSLSCLDVSNNFKEINPQNLKYSSKELIIKLNCGSLYELYQDEGAFGGHEDYIFESNSGKVFYLSNAYLHNTNQKFVFNPVDSTIVYFDKDVKQFTPTRNLDSESYWYKKGKRILIPIDTMKLNTSENVEKVYKLNDSNQLEPYMDLEGNEFSWSIDEGIYFVGYPGVFYNKKLKLCSLE